MPGPIRAIAGASTPAAAARDDTRARLLAAAVQVYAQHGHLGATTRAIAAEAGVNEVTLFRLFGSKDVLLDEAIAMSEGVRGVAVPLPGEPQDPLRELTAWCRAELAQLREGRALIRKCFADSEEHPNHVRPAADGMNAAAEALRAYVGRLARAGRIAVAPRQRDTAVAMLLASLMADALGRDEMGAVFRVPEAEAPRRYAAMFLGALAIHSED